LSLPKPPFGRDRDPEPAMTMLEAASALMITENSVRALQRTGGLGRAFDHDGNPRVPRADVEHLIEARE
jgi:hypothetical protein